MKAPLVKVIWDDAEDPDYSSAWHTEAEVDDFSKQTTLITSVGYRVRETEKYITLAADRIDGFGQFGRVTKIPRGVIVSVEVILAE